MTQGLPWRRAGVSIVIPALNEEEIIEATVAGARQALQRAGAERVEVVVVNDGSSDRTGAIAREAGATVIDHPHSAGYGRALKAGITAASHDIVAITDADGSYPLERLPDLLDQMDRGFDMVTGERGGKNLNSSATKGWLRAVLRFLVQFSSGRRVPDVNSGLRVFRRSTVRDYFPQLCDTFSFTTSMTLAYNMTGRFVAYVPIDYHQRVGRSKVRLFRESLRTLQFIVQAVVYYNPIKLFLLMSVMCLVISAVSLAVGIAFQIRSGFWLAVGAVLVSIVVFALGLLADLLRQIMGRPDALSQRGARPPESRALPGAPDRSEIPVHSGSGDTKSGS